MRNNVCSLAHVTTLALGKLSAVRFSFSCWSCILVAFLLPIKDGRSQSSQQSARVPLDLAFGVARHTRLAERVTDQYTLTLHGGEYVELDVIEYGAELTFRVLGTRPTDSLHATDFRNGVVHTATARWLASGEGRWTISVSFADSASPSTAYDILWRVRRPAAPADRSLLEADRAAKVALGLAAREAPFEQQDTAFRAAIALAERTDASRDLLVPDLLMKLAAASGMREEAQLADSLIHRAIAIRDRVHGGGSVEAALDRYALGWHYLLTGRVRDAEPLFRDALSVAEARLGREHLNVAMILGDYAIFCRRQGRFAEAEALNRRATRIYEQTLNVRHPLVTTMLGNLSVLLADEGRYAESESLFVEFGRRAASGDPGPLWRHNFATVYRDEGKFVEAEALFKAAVAEFDRRREMPYLAIGLRNLAQLYIAQRRFGDAESALVRARSIEELNGGKAGPGMASTLHLTAVSALGADRLGQADSLLRQALTIWESAQGLDHPNVATASTSLGVLKLRQGNYAQAESLFQRALRIRRTKLGPLHPDVAASLTNVALARWSRDSTAPVLPLVDSALAILAVRPSTPALRIEALALRARVKRAQGDTTNALGDIAAAISIAEDSRPNIAGDDLVRASVFGRYTTVFEDMIEWQLGVGDTTAAIEFAERGRARVLLDQLVAGRVNIRQGIPDAKRAALEAAENRSTARVAEFQRRLFAMQARTDLTLDEQEVELDRLADSLRRADREFQGIYQEIRDASPLWRSVLTANGRALSLVDVQRRLVPPGSLLLLYQIGDKQSFVFAIRAGNSRPAAFALRLGPEVGSTPGVASTAVTTQSLRQILGNDADVHGTPSLMNSLRRSPTSRPFEDRKASDEVLRQQLFRLWRALMPAELWTLVLQSAQVVVIPGQTLYTLPFEALVVKPGNAQKPSRYWLDVGPPIRYASSLTSLYSRTAATTAVKTPVWPSTASRAQVLTLSNPDFTVVRDEVRGQSTSLRRESGAWSPGARALETAAAPRLREGFASSGGSFSQLPASEAETQTIVQAFRGIPGYSVSVLQGKRAREGGLREALPGKRYVHIATHAIVDQSRSELFAAFALTPPPFLATPPEDDGFLQLYEIYGLRLSGLELAVLSACETNSGSVVDGEGVFALSRGFEAAGAQRVIASEWKVEDRSTSAVVGELFQRIARSERRGKGVDYARALRDAKLTVRAQSRWAHPFYWAPLVLSGTQ